MVLSDFVESLVEIREDVFAGFEANAEADHLRGDATRLLLLGVHLGVGGGGRVDGKRASIADVGDVADELQAVDELLTRLGRVGGLEAEHDHRATLALEVLLSLGVLGVILETGVLDPGNLWVFLEVLSHLHRVLAVSLHAEGQGLDALEEDPGVIGGDGRAEVAQGHGEHAQLVRQGCEGVREVVAPAKAAVGVIRLVKKRMFSTLPVEASLVDHDAADTSAVTADPLGQGRADDIRAVLERLGEIRRREGAVHDEGKAGVVRDLGDGFQVADLKRRVGHSLAEHGAGLVVDGRLVVVRVLGVHERNGDAEGGEDVVELGEGATVQLVAAHDVVASLSEVDDGVEDGGGSRGHREASEGVATLELSDAGLENVRGGVHEARVDVACLSIDEGVGERE